MKPYFLKKIPSRKRKIAMNTKLLQIMGLATISLIALAGADCKSDDKLDTCYNHCKIDLDWHTHPQNDASPAFQHAADNFCACIEKCKQ